MMPNVHIVLVRYGSNRPLGVENIFFIFSDNYNLGNAKMRKFEKFDCKEEVVPLEATSVPEWNKNGTPESGIRYFREFLRALAWNLCFF